MFLYFYIYHDFILEFLSDNINVNEELKKLFGKDDSNEYKQKLELVSFFVFYILSGMNNELVFLYVFSPSEQFFYQKSCSDFHV